MFLLLRNFQQIFIARIQLDPTDKTLSTEKACQDQL